MAEDIVARLRQAGRCLDGHICSTCDREVRDDMGCTCACHDYLWGDAADEIERLRGAIDLVIYAIENEGPVPKYHRDVMAFHVREWPTLWRAIYNLRKVRRG